MTRLTPMLYALAQNLLGWNRDLFRTVPNPVTCRSLACRRASYAASRGLTTIFLCTLLAAITPAPTQAQTVVATVPAGPNPAAMAVNETTNMIYVADLDLTAVTAINGATNAATTIQTGGTNGLSKDLAVNATTNTVYALNGGAQNCGLSGCIVTPGFVAVIDGATNTVTTTIALPALGSHIAVNPVTNQIYVSALNAIGNGAIVNVTVIDGSTNTITTTVSIPKVISSLAVDTVRDLIYAMNLNPPGNGTLAVIDGATNTVKASIPVGYNDNAFALNETTNTIYVPDVHGGQIYVIDGATDTVTTTVPIPGLESYWTINPVTNKIYLNAYVNNAQTVQVMDGSTNTITASISESSHGGLLVNSVTNKIWQESSPVVVIDGATNAVTSVTGSSGLYLVNGALNTATNYAYMAGLGDVYVINGAPAGPAFSASPSPLAFGNQTQGTTSGAKTLTVTNSGTTDLSITTVTPGGTNMADFIIGTDTCSDATVAAGKTCTVSVEFDPSTTAAESATLTFADNATDSPQVVDLTGTGVAPVATASTTTLVASATSVAVGTSVTFTATVTPASGTPTPTGTVTFKDGATTLGTGTLNGSGVATYSTSSLAEGAHSITASYGGDTRNLSSVSGSVAVTVAAASTTTALAASSTSAVVGSSITFTATVTGASGALAPTGTVTFMDGATTLGTGAVNGSGVATYSTDALASGAHSVTAAYSGDVNNAASTSSAVAVSVWPGPPSFTVSLSPASGSLKAGKDAVITVTVTSVNGFASPTTLACSNLPKNSTCTFSSTSITPGGSGTATSTLTIKTDTKPTTASLEPNLNGSRPGHTPFQGRIAIAGAAAAFLLIPLVCGKNRRLRRLLLAASSAAFIVTLASLGMSGCGGGPTTPKGTYTVTVSATSGAITQNATYTITVQ